MPTNKPARPTVMLPFYCSWWHPRHRSREKKGRREVWKIKKRARERERERGVWGWGRDWFAESSDRDERELRLGSTIKVPPVSTSWWCFSVLAAYCRTTLESLPDRSSDVLKVPSFLYLHTQNCWVLKTCMIWVSHSYLAGFPPTSIFSPTGFHPQAYFHPWTP